MEFSMVKISVGSTSTDDMTLVKQAQKGNRNAMGELFMRHNAMVRRLLAGILGSTDELDDLVQDVFIQVYRSIVKFRGDSKFTTWLHQVTVFVAYNYMRKPQKRYFSHEPDNFAETAQANTVTPMNDWDNHKIFSRIDEILASIKPPKRVAFMLHVVEEYSINEVAAMVGAPVATIKSRIWFARRELRKKAMRDPLLAKFLSK
jgi:RNA polymerase sigma-70 factor (ECF subfamily)